MFTHYGLFWKEADVLWSGWRGQPSALLGRAREPLGRKGAPTRAERDKATDYSNYVGVYCLYGSGELLYIGEAGLDTSQTLFRRLKAHRRGPLSGRWDSFSWFGRPDCKGHVPVKDSMAQLEAVAIAIINPGFNKQSGTFVRAKQVYQVAHEWSEGDVQTQLARMEETLNDIWERLDKAKISAIPRARADA